MYLDLDKGLVERFLNVVSSDAPAGKQKEQVVQDFLEEHPELIPTPNLLNHHLHFQSVVSKFPLSTELVTDYIYVTKSSDAWRVTLVELETPDKSIFTQDTKKTITTADFNAALNQVRSWKNFLDDNKAEVIRKLEPLLRPQVMQRNPVEFNYQLVIGRSEDKNLSEARKKHIRGLIKETGIDILTYDSVVNWYENNPRYTKNVLRLTGTHYTFKHMHLEPLQILSQIGPDYFELSQQHSEQLRAQGYEIDQWRKGHLLTVNGKYTTETARTRLAQGTLPVLDDK